MGWNSGVFLEGFGWVFSYVDAAEKNESEMSSAVDVEGHEDENDEDLGMSEHSKKTDHRRECSGLHCRSPTP